MQVRKPAIFDLGEKNTPTEKSYSIYICLLSVKLPVGVPQPTERRLVFTGQPMMEVDECVVTLHVLIQGSFQVPAGAKETQRKGIQCHYLSASQQFLLKVKLLT